MSPAGATTGAAPGAPLLAAVEPLSLIFWLISDSMFDGTQIE
jgi:hypothetical protein